MRPYAQYCPVSRALEVLGERWTLLIVRDMIIGARRFTEIARGLPGISRTGDGYELTRAGEDLRALVFGLADWGARHAFGEPRPEELDPELLMWWMHGGIDTRDVTKRTVVEVDLTDSHRTFWLVIEPGDASVCYTDPGFEVDAVLSTDLGTLYRVWEGEIEFLDAMRSGRLAVDGPRGVVRDLARWLPSSPVVPYVRTARLERAQPVAVREA
jgi:DNA-binding HxlR family transcriptional regulator